MMLSQILHMSTPDRSAVVPILYISIALLVGWFRPAPAEGPQELLTELCCWPWLLLWFEVIPWTGIQWTLTKVGPADDNRLGLCLVSVGIVFTAVGRSLDDCRWIQVSCIFTPCLPVLSFPLSSWTTYQTVCLKASHPTRHRGLSPSRMEVGIISVHALVYLHVSPETAIRTLQLDDHRHRWWCSNDMFPRPRHELCLFDRAF